MVCKGLMYDVNCYYKLHLKSVWTQFDISGQTCFVVMLVAEKMHELSLSTVVLNSRD